VAATQHSLKAACRRRLRSKS